MAALLTAAQQQELQELQQEFFEYQQYLQHRFEWYRRGDNGAGRSLDAIWEDFNNGHRARLNDIRARQVPRPNYPAELNNPKRALLAPRAVLGRTPYQYHNVNAPGPGAAIVMGAPKKRTATAEFRRAARIMTAKKSFHFLKILGAGGNGMVVLWQWTPGGDPLAEGHKVVMKLTTEVDANGDPEWTSINHEKRMMLDFVRARHIVQAFVFVDKLPPPTPNPKSVQQHRVANNLDAAQGLLFMEYSKLGDMRNSLERLTREYRDLPSGALWLIFDCLVKACIAMEYPPRLSRAGAPLPTRGNSLSEVVPPGGLAAQVAGFRGVVHFDLDPKNVFLFGYDPPGNTMNPRHTQVPRFQVGDFGLSQESAELWRPVIGNALDRAETRMETWQLRTMAKAGWFLPEQFTPEWDLLDRAPEEGPPNAPPGTWPAWNRWPITSGPGRYSHRSNIWHIGLNMWCLLLLQKPDFPAVAGRMRSEEPAVVPPALDVPYQDQRWTYGYRLIANDAEGQNYRARFTPGLCQTIAKCMMARQEHRPDLNQLQADITNALGNPPPALPGWVREFFGHEDLPPVPWPSVWRDLDLPSMDPFDPYPGYPDNEPVDPPSPPRKRRRKRMRWEDKAYN